MSIVSVAAVTFGVLVAIVVTFQLALAAGAPLGAYAMGGKFPGRLPPAMRVAAALQASVLGALAVIVMAHARSIALDVSFARWSIWIAVLVSAASLVLNLITPSKGERLVWSPVAALMLASSLVVALGG